MNAAQRTIAIVQARVGSSRFLRKALARIHGRPMIAHVLDRAKQIRGVDEIVLALPDDGVSFDVLGPIGHDLDVWVTVPANVGEDDVLGRFAHIAQGSMGFTAADVIVRITGDCPLLDPEESSAVVAALDGFDYATNRRPSTDGLDTEVMTFAVLERAHREAMSAYDREHVTSYIYRHPATFRIREYFGRELPRGEKWSVDTEADLELVRARYPGLPALVR